MGAMLIMLQTTNFTWLLPINVPAFRRDEEASRKQPIRRRCLLRRVPCTHELTLVNSASPLLEMVLAYWTDGALAILLKKKKAVNFC